MRNFHEVLGVAHAADDEKIKDALIIISLATIWLLTNGGQVLPSGQDRDVTRPKRQASAPQAKSLHSYADDLVRRLLPGRGDLL